MHITKGALGLIKSESELAGVLAHELAHVTEKHTIKAIQKSKMIDVGTDVAGSEGGLAGSRPEPDGRRQLQHAVREQVRSGRRERGGQVSAALTNRMGYSPKGLIEFLNHLAARNKGVAQPNGLFASHPQLEERVSKINKAIKDARLSATATVQPRYASFIKFDAKPVVEVTTVEDGTRGVAGGGSSTNDAEAKKEEAEKKEEPKKKGGFGVGSIASSLSGGQQSSAGQSGSSAGGRMIGPDNKATGGPNKTPVRVSVSAADIAEFKKGIA